MEGYFWGHRTKQTSMRKLSVFLILSFAAIQQLPAQFVGINTNAPQAMLHVKDSNVLLSGPTPFVNYAPAAMPPAQGAGTRMMWYAQKGAFRAGWVEDNRWDKDSIGIFSIAMGHSTMAANTGSTALGVRTNAMGFASTAMGWGSKANGDYSFAAGFFPVASASSATAIGTENLASGFYSTALGIHTVASGNSATAIGDSSIASGAGSIAIGSYVRAKGYGAFAAGLYNDIGDNPDPVFPTPTDRLFQVGNGSGFTVTRSNALTVLRNGNHGLGTVSPVARLHVADSNVVFTGPNNVLASTAYNPPMQGPGARMMWYPQKAAFRAGLVFGNQWDKDSIGILSIALGNSTKAKGESSFASGAGTNASGIRSTATGDFTTASGNGSFSGGNGSTASGLSAVAFGSNTISSGDYSFAAGSFNTATGFGAVAFGQISNATSNSAIAMGIDARASAFASVAIGHGVRGSGQNSVALGKNTNATGNNSFAAGLETKTKADHSTVFGVYNDSADAPVTFSPQPDDRIFQIGIGSANNDRKNALTILRNNRTGIGTVTPVARLHVADSSVLFTANGQASASPGVPPVSGTGRRMMWYVDKAAFRAGFVNNDQWNKDNIGDYTFATGYDTKASIIGAVATGIGSTASGFTSVAMGYGLNATGGYSTAFGYFSNASGIYSLAVGNTVTAAGMSAVALGEQTTAKAVGSFTTGRFNENSDNPNNFTPASTDRIFQIANGSDVANRSNAVTVLRNGNMGIGNLNPAKPLSFPATLGEKILLYPGGGGEVGIGVYGNELRIHSDNPGAMVSFGTQDNAGNFTQAGRFQISGGFALYANGNVWANGTTYASDERFKQNITSIQSPLEKLMQINGVEYEMNTTAFSKNNFQKGRQIGLLAQNVEKVIPEAVNELDGYKGVDYARLVPLLIEALKEQQQQRKQDLERIEKLEKMISELKK